MDFKGGAATIFALLTLLTSATTSPYAPTQVTCPTIALVRPATCIGAGEAQYIEARKPIADAALSSWLRALPATFNTSTLPTIALSGSGGGYRALLNEAGIIQAIDARDSKSSVSGLYQALSYHSALSGGGWLANSLAAWNWPTISYLQKQVYEPNLAKGLLDPDGLMLAVAYGMITNDVQAKDDAGYPVTLGDTYGRLLGYNLFPGADGGVSLTMSGLRNASNFTEHAVPFPIITSIGTNSSTDSCTALPDATQYEVTPYEFGSWDEGIRSFVDMEHLGTNLVNGNAKNASQCTEGFDNLGFLTATTSNVFSGPCDVSGIRNLTDPIWPFLQPERSVSALIVADSCGDNETTYYCNGQSPHNTYLQAQAKNLTKMPTVPTPTEFNADNLTMRAQFFGCHQPDTVTLIWLPLVSYTSPPSNFNGFDVEVPKSMTDNTIRNGNLVATQNGNKNWPMCLACGLMLKAGGPLPEECTACLDEYCVT